MAALAMAPVELNQPPARSNDFTVRDPDHAIVWMRCSVGQIWNGKDCDGRALLLTKPEAEEAAVAAQRQFGGNWRIPSLEELESLLCETCAPPRIDQSRFPGTPAAPFWTSTDVRLSIGRFWTVSFMTGHRFGRNVPSMARYLRLVRNE